MSKAFYLKLILLLLFAFASQNSLCKVNCYCKDLPVVTIKKIYDFYKEPYYSVSKIENIYKCKESSESGIYTFRVCYSPHYPTKCILLLYSKPYCLNGEAFFSANGIMTELVYNLAKAKCPDNLCKEISIAMYTFLYDEYGLSYGRHRYPDDFPSFKSNEEKNIYLMSMVRDMDKLNKYAIYMNNNDKFMNTFSFLLKSLNDEETIVLLGILGNQHSRM